MQRQLLQMFLKFALAQVTLLISFSQLNRIILYYQNDLHYVAVGPYMLLNSKLPKPNNCYEFYEEEDSFVTYLGGIYTPDQYMQKIEYFTWHQGKALQLSLAAMSLAISVIIQFLGFISQNQTIFVLDNLFTMLLPHFILLVNTVSWGSSCIEYSSILDIFEYLFLDKIGFITLGATLFLLILYLGMAALGLEGDLSQFCFGLIISIYLVYVLIIDFISFYCSPTLILLLFLTKFVILGTLLCSLYKIY